MPYQHRSFQPGYNPHYYTSTPISNEPAMSTHYAEPVRRSDRAVPTATSTSHSYEEANKPSLPSISNLLGIAADGERTSVSSQGTCKSTSARAVLCTALANTDQVVQFRSISSSNNNNTSSSSSIIITTHISNSNNLQYIRLHRPKYRLCKVTQCRQLLHRRHRHYGQTRS